MTRKKRRAWGRWRIKGGILFREDKLAVVDILAKIPPGPADAGKLIEDTLTELREKGIISNDAENLVRRFAGEIAEWERRTGRQYPAREREHPRFTKKILKGESHGPETTGGDKEEDAL